MGNRPFVKVCGITRKADLICAVESGADAIGFIAYPKSPRYVSASEVKLLLDDSNIDNFLKVAVFVNAAKEDIQAYLNVGIDVIQLHGNESADFAASFDCEVWKAIRLNEESQISIYRDYPCAKFLIDSFVKDAEIPGGTGHLANWRLARSFVDEVDKDVLLAGGISNLNLAEALTEVKPFGLDLSSSVETSPGVKDHHKIQELFTEVNRLFT